MSNIEAPLSPSPRLVFVVDDEAGIRNAIARLLVGAGFAFRCFENGIALLNDPDLQDAQCIVLDLMMPHMSGLAVQAELTRRSIAAPIIFLTGSASVPTAVTAMRAGAFDYIEKPFDNDELVERVRCALSRQLAAANGPTDHEELQRFVGLLTTLTQREREVMDQVVTGKTSKQIARVLGASHRTIEIHRRNLMKKLGIVRTADLVRLHVLAGRSLS